jgi:uridine kinase
MLQTMNVVSHLANAMLTARLPGRPMVLGINGVDGSGKTTLAGAVADDLAARELPVCVISVDDFHYPRNVRARRGPLSPEGFRYDAINLAALADKALSPIAQAGAFPVSIATAVWSIDADAPVERRANISADTMVVVEGVFLFDYPVLPLLDLKVYVRADFETTPRRVQSRDCHIFGSADAVVQRYRTKYIPGQQLYLQEVQPEQLADIVVDNNNFERPLIVKDRLKGMSPSGGKLTALLDICPSAIHPNPAGKV